MKEDKVIYEINCAYCGDEFEAKRNNTRFCSDNCRVKNHQSKKKREDAIQPAQIVNMEEDHSHKVSINNKTARLRYQCDNITLHWQNREKRRKRARNILNQIQLDFNLAKLKITERKEQQERWKQQIQFNEGERKRLKALSGKTDYAMTKLNLIWDAQKVEQAIPDLRNRIEKEYGVISSIRKNIVHMTSKYGKWKSKLEELTKEQKELTTEYEKREKAIQELQDELEKQTHFKPVVAPSPIVNPVPQRIIPKRVKAPDEIGGADLQLMRFESFQLPGYLGAFLGELDWNKTCFALTGNSGAGKSWFSFQLAALFIAGLGQSVKYFSLEEGIGKLTKEKVTAFGLGNELVLTGTGTLGDVRKAAKEYSIVFVDSFNKLDAKADDFEKLRTEFPKTIFVLIFQKTTSGTMRGGSSIKYNSSATIDVVKRDGERIAIMEKGRYGTIGWEFSITSGEVIKTHG